MDDMRTTALCEPQLPVPVQMYLWRQLRRVLFEISKIYFKHLIAINNWFILFIGRLLGRNSEEFTRHHVW